jgi:transposase-like protein
MEVGKSVSVTAEQYEIHPNNIFNWRKQLFEGAIKHSGLRDLKFRKMRKRGTRQLLKKN